MNGKGKPEIWAYGLRNPWRFSFDRAGKRLYCADVGQNEYEEIDIIEKGKNYGWRIMEGRHCYDPKTNCSQEGLTLPVYEYSHSVGRSITGGFVYRGNKNSIYYGRYIYGDWTGKVFSLAGQQGKWNNQELKIKDREDLYINSFGEDSEGNLYMLTNEGADPKSAKGGVYRLEL